MLAALAALPPDSECHFERAPDSPLPERYDLPSVPSGRLSPGTLPPMRIIGAARGERPRDGFLRAHALHRKARVKGRRR